MEPKSIELWRRLESFQFDEPQVALPFTARLARENGWSREFAHRVTHEYKRFAFLCVVAGHPCTPSEQVDQAWHLHLIYTRSYWDAFCGGVLRQPLHHGPTRGGAEEAGKYTNWYARTLTSYRLHFGEPPVDIWPPAAKRFGEDIRVKRVNVARNWVIAKPKWWPVMKLVSLLGAGGLVVGGCGGTMFGYVPVFDWNGPEFLRFYAIGYVVALALTWWQYAAWNRSATRRAAAVPIPTDLYALAVLTGGAVRAAQVAIVNLVNAGTFRLGGNGSSQLVIGGPLPESAHPVERAIYANLLSRGDSLAGATFVTEAAELPEVRSLVEGQGNHLRSPRKPRVDALLPLLLIGLTKLVIGLVREKPVGFLVLLLVVTVITAGLIQSRVKSWRQRLSERFGSQVGDLKRELAANSERSHAGTPMAVSAAVFGLGALGGTALSALASELAPPPPRNTFGSSSGCGSDGGGGGGGCGGGGCGGCGGGD